jgi:hypothetical protein
MQEQRACTREDITDSLLIKLVDPVTVGFWWWYAILLLISSKASDITHAYTA